MKRKIWPVSLVLIVLMLLAFFWLCQHNPSFLIASRRAGRQVGLVKDIPANEEITGGYPEAPIEKIVRGKFQLPRATVQGVVTGEERFEDGDWHINLSDGKNILVCEIIPEFPMKIPKVGDNIKIRGITRYDLEHCWWELHPVLGWEQK